MCETEVQIINLGCGFDTLYWRLRNDRNIRERWSKIRISSFVDVDFPSTTMRKVHYIKNNKALLATLNNDGKFLVIPNTSCNQRYLAMMMMIIFNIPCILSRRRNKYQ